MCMFYKYHIVLQMPLYQRFYLYVFFDNLLLVMYYTQCTEKAITFFCISRNCFPSFCWFYIAVRFVCVLLIARLFYFAKKVMTNF